MRKAIVVLMLLAVMSVCLVAETVITKGGVHIMGKIVAKEKGFIYVQTEKGLKKVAISDIKEIKNDANIGITKRTLRKKDFNKGIDLTKAEVVKVERFNEKMQNFVSQRTKGIIVNKINLDTLDLHYIEIIAIDNRFFKGVRSNVKLNIFVSYGQALKSIPTYNDLKKQILTDEKGNKLTFNSIVDALNYFYKNGWKLYTQYLVKNSSYNNGIYHFLLERR